MLNNKYKINYFINLTKQLERETRYGIVNITQVIAIASKYSLPDSARKEQDNEKVNYTYTTGFSWYVIRDMLLHRFADRDGKPQLGVIRVGVNTVAV